MLKESSAFAMVLAVLLRHQFIVISANKIECEYKLIEHISCSNEDDWDKLQNNTYYGCVINNILPSSIKTVIEGIHEDEKSDEDVQVITVEASNSSTLRLSTFDSSFCEKFYNLEIIAICGVGIKSVDSNSFLSCKNLKTISMINNSIVHIPEDIFIENSKLARLELQSNNITNLPEKLFANTPSLGVLNIYYNQINELPPKIFKMLSNLLVLDMTGINLKKSNPLWFRNLEKLQVLDLSRNAIPELPENIFDNVVNLKELIMIEINLESIDRGLFYNLVHLETLDFSLNYIKELPEDVFRNLKNLKSLVFGDNLVEILKPGLFDGLIKLEVLSFRKNKISSLPPNIFTPLPNLKKMWMFENQITEIHGDSFGYNNKLEHVSFYDNKIIAVDVNFTSKTTIKILDMRLNICSNDWIETYQQKELLKNCFANYKPRTDTELVINTFNLCFQKKLELCGRSEFGVGNIIGGDQAPKGAFPWMAALVYGEKDNFFCGGTLITTNRVISAAHCFKPKNESSEIDFKALKVFLGAYDLSITNEIGRIIKSIADVIIHNNWDQNAISYDGDIAIIFLWEDVVFSDAIKPICIMESDSDAANVKNGIVVGYGKSEDPIKKHETLPKVINIPIQKSSKCYPDFPELAIISSDSMFCGGSADGTGVCKGDSGGSLIVEYKGIYYFRGIVSASLFKDSLTCDVEKYALYTNVLNYIDWISMTESDIIISERK